MRNRKDTRWPRTAPTTRPATGVTSAFDRVAATVAALTSKAPFFVAGVLLVLVWAGWFALFSKPDTWQLVINTSTTIVTFLLVALLQNTSTAARRRCSTSSTRSPTASPT